MDAQFDEALARVLALNALMREDIALARLTLYAKTAASAFKDALEQKFNPNWSFQPRALAGAPNGGQWVDGGGAAPRARSPRPRQMRDRVRVGRDTSPREFARLPLRVFSPVGAAVTLPSALHGDTPRPYQTTHEASDLPGVVLVQTHYPGSVAAHFERVLTPERQEPILFLGHETGLHNTIPAVRERLNVAVSIEDGHAVFDRAELEQALEHSRSRATSIARPSEVPGSGFHTETDEERLLVSIMAARGAPNHEIQNALEDLRRNRGSIPSVLELVQRAPRQPLRIARINMAHIFDGDVRRNRRGDIRGSGGHYLRSHNIRIVRIIRPADSRGVIEARIEVRDPVSGRWAPKSTPSTFFPETWSRRRVQMEIESAWEHSYRVEGDLWRGRSPSGIMIEGYYTRPQGDAASAWPVRDGDDQ